MGYSSSKPAGICHGIDISAQDVPKESWWAAIPVSGKLYGVPCNAERLLMFDAQTESISSTQPALAVAGAGKWRSAVAAASGSKVIGIPDRAEHLLVYDIPSGKPSFVDTRSLGSGTLKWQSAFLLGGKVYGVPYNADRILVYDPSAGKVSGIVTTSIARGINKWCAGAVLGGKLYGMPASASCILVYDPVTQKPIGIDVSHLSCGLSGKMKWLSALAYGGKLYGIPCHAECILVYDPVSGNVTGIDTSGVAKGDGKWMSVVLEGSKFYGIPDHAEAILIFDTVTATVSSVSVAHIASGPYKWQTGAALLGKIYAAPFDCDKLLMFDPSTCEATGIDTIGIASGSGKWGTTMVLGGRVYGIPWNAKNLLSFTPDTSSAAQPAVPDAAVESGESDNTEKELTVDLAEELSIDIMHDFTASWLSAWVYRADNPSQPSPVPSLTVGGIAISFEILAMHEEPLQGSPARLAVVAAEFPRAGKALFFVFKGSSYMTDFVANANISPDYAPFNRVFQDRTTFVHHGAQHAITQLGIHQRDTLFQIIEKAADSGTEHLIVTGHSLGGQYAMAFLLEAFLDMSAPAQPSFWTPSKQVSPLWKKARCVTFGSPMCFGSAEGSEVRTDLREFFSVRAVNYINGGDPCARLWSEIDMEGFVRYLSLRLREQIPSSLRSLVDWAIGPGGMAQKAEELLQRPDLQAQMLRPARQYVHISSIRILSNGFRPWRPLGHDGIRIEDHEIRYGYLPAFRDALDPAAEMGLFMEDGSKVLR